MSRAAAARAGAAPPDPAFLAVERVREDFPILSRQVHGKPLVYLDNAASTQKPRPVLAALERFYSGHYANVHRGIHLLSEEATELYEEARGKVRAFLNAPRREEIAFVRGTTEAINLVAQTWGRAHVGPGDEVLVTHMEHHSNIVPWQLLCEERGARLRVVPVDEKGRLAVEELDRLLGARTRMVALAHVSNVLGTVNPVADIARLAHERGALVLVDGAQAAAHLTVDLEELGCDFYAFSGHKLYGPTGIGVLWGRWELLESMPPYQGGGEMIRSVRFEKTEFKAPPHRFEAGTPHIAGAVGLGAAIDYLESLGREAVEAHEADLLAYAEERLREIPGLRIVGQAPGKTAVVSLTLEGVHPHDIGTIVDREGVAVRAGHHCAQPLMERFGVAATARASFALYNTRAEVDRLAESLWKVKEVFG